MSNFYEKLEIPKNNRNTSISKKEAKFIFKFLQTKRISRTLEIGFAYGCSTAFIISATKKPHFVIDPFQSQYHDLGLKNIKKLKLNKYLHFIKDFSHNALPTLIKKKMLFDFVFIDGGHKFDEIFVDFYFVDLLLKKGGYVLFNDAWMRSTQLVASWIKTNKSNYEIIKLKDVPNNFVMFKKMKGDKRQWYHFEEFYNRKSVASHNKYKLKRKSKKD